MLDLRKMKEATAQAARNICDKRSGPCVGLCMLFIEIDDNGEKRWGLETHLVGDAANPIEEKERADLTKAMQYVMKNAILLYEGQEVHPKEGGH